MPNAQLTVFPLFHRNNAVNVTNYLALSKAMRPENIVTPQTNSSDFVKIPHALFIPVNTHKIYTIMSMGMYEHKEQFLKLHSPINIITQGY